MPHNLHTRRTAAGLPELSPARTTGAIVRIPAARLAATIRYDVRFPLSVIAATLLMVPRPRLVRNWIDVSVSTPLDSRGITVIPYLLPGCGIRRRPGFPFGFLSTQAALHEAFELCHEVIRGRSPGRAQLPCGAALPGSALAPLRSDPGYVEPPPYAPSNTLIYVIFYKSAAGWFGRVAATVRQNRARNRGLPACATKRVLVSWREK